MIEVDYLRGQRETVVVTSDGSVTWIPPVKMTSMCKFDPLSDEQNCDVKFGSWVYNGLLLNISMVYILAICVPKYVFSAIY